MCFLELQFHVIFLINYKRGIKIIEINLKPSIIKSLYKIEQSLKECGLSEKDILILLQSRIRPRISQKIIKSVLNGIQQLELNIELNKKRFKTK